MDFVDKKEVRGVLAAIALAHPARFKVAKSELEGTVKLWHKLLADMPRGSALSACTAILASNEHPPTVAEIRSRALSVRRGVGKAAAVEAWGEVTRAIGRVGRNGSPQWSSPAVARAVRAIGGWVHICNSENPAADRAKFVDHYGEQVENAVRQVLSGDAPDIRTALAGEPDPRVPSLEADPEAAKHYLASQISGELAKRLTKGKK